jgi:hypothetical protein
VDQFGGHDLTAPSTVADPFGDDHRLTEEVASLSDGLAGVQPGSEEKPLILVLGVMIVNGLLHGDGARDGIHCAGKDHHEPVPEALDLVAAAALHGVSEQTEVAAPDAVRGVVSESLDQF